MSSDSQNGSPEPEYLRLADLSLELQINALQTLGCPVIGIIPDGQQLGSGVLVEVDRVSGILTVEHVIIRPRPKYPRTMNPEPTATTSPIGDTPRIIGTLTTRSNKPGRRSKARTYSNFGQTETHRVTIIKLKPEDRAALQAIARRYRVKSLTRFLEVCLAAEDRKGSEQVLVRMYED
jgi:hypothetical protein